MDRCSIGRRDGHCTWAKLGLFGFLAFFPSFIVFLAKNGFASIKNTGFYSIPAGPSDHFFGKTSCWAKCYHLQYIHASVRSLNDLLVCHMCAKSHVLLEIFAKGPKCQLRDPAPDFGQILLLTAFSLLNAKRNFSPQKTLQNWGKNAKKPNRPNFAPLPVAWAR